jgi:hypothetical protein
MASPFDSLDLMIQGVVDGCFGESFRFEPMRTINNVNAPRVVDNTRAVITTTAIFHATATRVDAGATYGRVYDAQSPGLTSARPQVTVKAESLGWMPLVGDRIVRISDSTAWRVSEVVPDGNGQRITLDLNEEKPS